MAMVEKKTAVLGLKRVTLSVRIALVENQVYYRKLGYDFVAYGTHEGYAEPTFMVLAKVLRDGEI